jgi:hypothetical protein
MTTGVGGQAGSDIIPFGDNVSLSDRCMEIKQHPPFPAGFVMPTRG